MDGSHSCALGTFGIVVKHAYNQRQLLTAQQAQLTYERQLKGQLDDKEREIQTLNTKLGLAEAKLISQSELDELYAAQLTLRDREMEQFRKEHNLQIASLTNAVFSLSNKVKGGTTTVGGTPVTPSTDPATQPAALAYEYYEPNGRAVLKDVDIYTPDNEEFSVSQMFMLNGKVFRQEQKDGFLKTEKLELTEIVRQADGSYAAIGVGKLVSAKFSYADSAPVAKRPADGWDMSVLAIAGTTFDGDKPLAFGGGVNIARWQFADWASLGGGVGIVSNLTKEGTALMGLVAVRPTVAGRDLNLTVNGGLGIGVKLEAVPTVGVGFVVW